jgi:hypothetical protein
LAAIRHISPSLACAEYKVNLGLGLAQGIRPLPTPSRSEPKLNIIGEVLGQGLQKLLRRMHSTGSNAHAEQSRSLSANGQERELAEFERGHLIRWKVSMAYNRGTPVCVGSTAQCVYVYAFPEF